MINKYVKELDGLRAIAIIMVLIYHYLVNIGQPISSSGGLQNLLALGKIFWTGVDLFFILSGFLIGGVILDNYKKKSFFKAFYMRRFYRIIPLYIIFVGIGFILQLSLSEEQEVWLFTNHIPIWPLLTFTQNYYMGMAGMFAGGYYGVSWSLAVEEQFYLLMPFLTVILGAKRLIIVIGVSVIAVVIRRFYVLDNIGSYVFTHLRLDALLIGVLISIIYRSEKCMERVKKNNKLILILFVFSFLAAVLYYKLSNFGAHRYTLFMVAYSLVFVLILNNQNKTVLAPLRSQFLSFFSKISYCLYLVHQPIIGLVFLLFSDSAVPYRDYSLILLAVFISILVATGSYYLIEKSMIMRGRKYNYG